MIYQLHQLVASHKIRLDTSHAPRASKINARLLANYRLRNRVISRNCSRDQFTTTVRIKKKTALHVWCATCYTVIRLFLYSCSPTIMRKFRTVNISCSYLIIHLTVT